MTGLRLKIAGLGQGTAANARREHVPGSASGAERRRWFAAASAVGGTPTGGRALNKRAAASVDAERSEHASVGVLLPLFAGGESKSGAWSTIMLLPLLRFLSWRGAQCDRDCGFVPPKAASDDDRPWVLTVVRAAKLGRRKNAPREREDFSLSPRAGRGRERSERMKGHYRDSEPCR